METHPLNLAHQQHRRAEAHLMSNRYDEALQCHRNAAELLLDAMKSTTSSVALESISLQHSYHLKQKDLINSKKEQYVRVKKALDNIKQLGKDTEFNVQGLDSAKLQVDIYRNINETDSLLFLLNKKDTPNEGLLLNAATKDVEGKKIEKSKESVVEELQILNQNLHSLVEQLVIQVEVLKDENSTLREKVIYLEKERVKYLNLQTPQGEKLERNYDIEPAFRTDARGSISRPTVERPIQQPHFDLSALKNN